MEVGVIPCRKLVTGQDTGRMKMHCRNADTEQIWKQVLPPSPAAVPVMGGNGKAGKSGRSAGAGQRSGENRKERKWAIANVARHIFRA